MRQLVCTQCGAANRFPDDRDPRAAKCGQCHVVLLTGAPVAVDEAQLAKHRGATKGVALLLDVWAPWCGPCQAMAPQLEKAAELLAPDVRVLKLNSDEAPGAAQALGVRGIPALFLFAEDRVIAQQSGAMPASEIVSWTRKALTEATAR